MNTRLGRIDTHHHVMHEFWREAVGTYSPGGGLAEPRWSSEGALALMDDTECRVAILSVPSPGVHFGDDLAASDLARRINEASADVVRARPDRFGFFASLPVPDIDGALRETGRVFDELGADGVILLANTLGQYLGDSALDPLMGELDRRGAVVFVHPGALPGPVVPGIPSFVADFLLDTVRAVISLVMHDVPHRFPRIRFLLAHGGGFLPYVPGRLDSMLRVIGASDERLAQLRTFWYDTALTSGRSSLPSLLAFASPDRVTYGSDFPYATPQIATHFCAQLDAYEMSADLREAINTTNAQTLLPRFADN